MRSEAISQEELSTVFSTAELKHTQRLPQGTLRKGPFLGTCSPCAGRVRGRCRSHFSGVSAYWNILSNRKQ